MVDRMEKKGWVVRRADAGDRRVNRLHLTQEALLIQVRLAQIADRTVDDALALLSPRERDQFVGVDAAGQAAAAGDARTRCGRADRARRESAASSPGAGPVTRPHPKIVRLVLLVLVPIAVVLVGGVIWLHGGRTRRHRRRLRQDRHGADRAGSVGPRRRGAGARSPERRGRHAARQTRPRAVPAGARQGRGRTRQGPHRCRNRARAMARDRERAARSRKPHRVSDARGGAPARAGGQRQRRDHQARRGAERRERRARPGGDRQEPAGAHAGRARRRPGDADRRASRWCARRRPSATAPSSTSSAPTIKAPIGGTAVNVKLQPGEQVKAATPIFVLVSKTRPWVEANMKETDLTHVKPGQQAEVVLDIYPGRHLEGRGREHQPGDRRRVRDPAAAERVRQLGQGRAAPAGAGPAVCRTRASRRCAPG